MSGIKSDATKAKRSAARGDSTPVTRKEFRDVLQQISENMAEISKYVTEDINTLFQKYVYPVYMKQQAIINLMAAGEEITDDKVITEANRLIKEAMDAAKPVDENGNIIEETVGEEVAGEEAVEVVESTEEEVPKRAEVIDISSAVNAREDL